MMPRRRINRRSFFVRVAGGAVIGGGGALALLRGSGAAAQNIRYSGVTDCDTGQGADRPGFGTGYRNQFTDNDTGPSSDPRCQGRGSNTGANSGTQYSPSDNVYSGCSDRDYGSNGDPGGYGRSCRGGISNSEAPRVSGCTDRDPTDSIGNGRNCRPQR
jgi:hypothetical protein